MYQNLFSGEKRVYFDTIIQILIPLHLIQLLILTLYHFTSPDNCTIYGMSFFHGHVKQFFVCLVFFLPAVDDYGPSLWNSCLGPIDLLQKAQNPSRLVGHAMVRPAQVLVVPDVPGRLPLFAENQDQKFDEKLLTLQLVTCDTLQIEQRVFYLKRFSLFCAASQSLTKGGTLNNPLRALSSVMERSPCLFESPPALAGCSPALCAPRCSSHSLSQTPWWS